MTTDAQAEIDRRNAEFWDELCGSTLARSLGIEDASEASLVRFDEAYLSFYPYLEALLPRPRRAGERLLEVGLGYGTVSALLARRGFTYSGIDIAEGPVAMVNGRLERGQLAGEARVGSALDLPFPDQTFDAFVSIGCFHHTGNVPKALDEARRVLRPGGRLVVMVYNAHSFRRLVEHPVRRSVGKLRGPEDIRRAYDVNASGAAAPQTEFFSVSELRRLLSRWDDVMVLRKNFDNLALRGRVLIPRDRLLGLPAKLAGLDLYAFATRSSEGPQT